MPAEHQVVVVGQIARDIVLQIDSIPAAGSAAPADVVRAGGEISSRLCTCCSTVDTLRRFSA